MVTLVSGDERSRAATADPEFGACWSGIAVIYALNARCHRELAQDQANRSKKAKVIFRRIDSVRANPVAAGLWRQSQDRSVIEKRLVYLIERADGPLLPQSTETQHVKMKHRVRPLEITDAF